MNKLMQALLAGLCIQLLSGCCGCRIDKFEVVQGAIGDYPEPAYLEKSRPLAVFDASNYEGQTLYSVNAGTEEPVIRAYYRKAGSQLSVVYFEPSQELLDWRFEVAKSDAAKTWSGWTYNADYFDYSGDGLVFSNGRIYHQTGQKKRFVDLIPYSSVSLTGVRTSDGLTAVAVKTRGASIFWRAISKQDWSKVDMACDLPIGPWGAKAVAGKVITVCRNAVRALDTVTGNVVETRLPTANQLVFYGITPDIEGSQAIISGVLLGQGTRRYYLYRDDQLFHLKDWDGMLLNKILWSLDGEVVTTTREGVSRASALGGSLSSVLPKPGCYLTAGRSLSFIYALCPGALKIEEMEQGNTTVFPAQEFPFSEVYRSIDGGVSWNEVTATFGL